MVCTINVCCRAHLLVLISFYIYLNPGKDKFQSIRKKKYIDKSALISCVNANLDTWF